MNLVVAYRNNAAVKLSDIADVVYKQSNYYEQELERGIAYNDPDVAIAWNQVTLTLSTHSAGGLTAADFALARQISALSA